MTLAGLDTLTHKCRYTARTGQLEISFLHEKFLITSDTLRPKQAFLGQ